LDVYYKRLGSTGLLEYLRVVVRSTRWPLKGGLKVGSSAKAIESVLGPPGEVATGRLIYRGETELVTFTVAADKATQIEFSYYAD
jgi:hypothetical protein